VKEEQTEKEKIDRTTHSQKRKKKLKKRQKNRKKDYHTDRQVNKYRKFYT
jgi:hypothetical protein